MSKIKEGKRKKTLYPQSIEFDVKEEMPQILNCVTCEKDTRLKAF